MLLLAEVPVPTIVLVVVGMTTELKLVPYWLAHTLQPFQF